MSDILEGKNEPYKEGRDAYMQGVPLSGCPYPSDSDEAVEWEGGWIEAEENED